jgi:hypothetical protein
VQQDEAADLVLVATDVDVAPVRALDRLLEHKCVCDGEADADPEREAQVVCGDKVRRICDRHLDEFLFEEANRENAPSARTAPSRGSRLADPRRRG